MSKELAVLVIHGMGSQSRDFAEDMIHEINDRLKNPDLVAWQSIYWADVLESRELNYLNNAKKGADLDFFRLRKFVVTAFGDASAYQNVKSATNTTYEDIHARIEANVKEIYETQLMGQNKPLVILAHSLGGHIMSNYIWDAQRKPKAAWSTFERMATHAGMITFGCNIPLFTFAYKDVKPIKFPGNRLSKELKKNAKWLNFFDPDDVLGYPLKPINAEYRRVVTRDIPINVGGILSSWNPMSHNGYWTDNDFTKPVARFISSLLP